MGSLPLRARTIFTSPMGPRSCTFGLCEAREPPSSPPAFRPSPNSCKAISGHLACSSSSGLGDSTASMLQELVTKGGLGLLLVGPSGSGKSTLAIGLIRHGWHYLSDDAVLLRSQAEGVEALALRKHFYIDADAAASSVELPLGEEVPDSRGRRRRRVYLEGVSGGRYVAGCFPHVLLFCRIVPQAQSSLLPLDRVHALKHLLAASGPQLFDRRSMNAAFGSPEETASAGRDL